MSAGRFGRRRGRAEAPGARFLGRYPVLWVLPMSALFLGIAYAYAAGLERSWSDIHGARVAAVFAGAALGVALVVAAAIGHRRGVSRWLMVPGVVVIVGFVITRQQIAPAVGSAGKVTSVFEAAVFALCSVLWCVSAIAFLGFLPRLWRTRMAFSQPGRGLHITRAPHWREASTARVPLTEWLEFAKSRDDLTAYDPREPQPGELRAQATERQLRASRDLIATRPELIARNPDLARMLPPDFRINTFAYERGDGSRMYLTWFDGEIVIAGVGRDRPGDVARMQPIAWALGANLVDDDGTVYQHA